MTWERKEVNSSEFGGNFYYTRGLYVVALTFYSNGGWVWGIRRNKDVEDMDHWALSTGDSFHYLRDAKAKVDALIDNKL